MTEDEQRERMRELRRRLDDAISPLLAEYTDALCWDPEDIDDNEPRTPMCAGWVLLTTWLDVAAEDDEPGWGTRVSAPGLSYPAAMGMMAQHLFE